jgi:hypothetical protein
MSASIVSTDYSSNCTFCSYATASTFARRLKELLIQRFPAIVVGNTPIVGVLLDFLNFVHDTARSASFPTGGTTAEDVILPTANRALSLSGSP